MMNLGSVLSGGIHMWKRDISAGCIGFAAGSTLFAMVHYLMTPGLVEAAAFVLCAVAFVTAVIHYALALVGSTPVEAATSRGRTVAASV
jgi:hypothetical protein